MDDFLTITDPLNKSDGSILAKNALFEMFVKNNVSGTNNSTVSFSLGAGDVIVVEPSPSGRTELSGSVIMDSDIAYSDPNNCRDISNIYASSTDIESVCSSSSHTYYSHLGYNNPSREEVTVSTETFLTTSRPSHYSTLDALPNPATESVTFYYTSTDAEAAYTLSLTDMVGRPVATVFRHRLAPVGRQQVQFSLASIPAGVYLYTLESSHGSETKRLVVR